MRSSVKMVVSAASMLALFAPALASAQSDELQRCRTIADAKERLDCYDAVNLPRQGATGPAPAMVQPAAQFGLDEARATASQELAGISSRVNGRIDGWGPNTVFELANGQQWKVVDDSRCVCAADNPVIEVARGTFGGYLLNIEGYNRTARVKRVR